MDMPMKKKRQTVASQAAARGPLPELPKELLDQLVKGPMTPAEVQDLMLAFNKAVITDRGPVRVDVPRDRDGSFEPILIPKHERRFTGFNERIIAMYARGMSVREIRAFLAESYGTEISPDFISSVTDEVMAEALSWQSRPLETMYPVVFFDALRVKIRADSVARTGTIAPSNQTPISLTVISPITGLHLPPSLYGDAPSDYGANRKRTFSVPVPSNTDRRSPHRRHASRICAS